MYIIRVSHSCAEGTTRYGIDIYGETAYDLRTLAWPLILQWKRQLKKEPDVDVMVYHEKSGFAFGNSLKQIKQDQLDNFLFEALGYSRAR
jgi:hypothetical protein